MLRQNRLVCLSLDATPTGLNRSGEWVPRLEECHVIYAAGLMVLISTVLCGHRVESSIGELNVLCDNGALLSTYI